MKIELREKTYRFDWRAVAGLRHYVAVLLKHTNALVLWLLCIWQEARLHRWYLQVCVTVLTDTVMWESCGSGTNYCFQFLECMQCFQREQWTIWDSCWNSDKFCHHILATTALRRYKYTRPSMMNNDGSIINASHQKAVKIWSFCWI